MTDKRPTPEQIIDMIARLPLGEQFHTLTALVLHLEHDEGVERATLVEAVEGAGR